MITATIETNQSLKAVIPPRDQVIFAKLNANDQILYAKFEQKVELEPYYETDNLAGGTTIIIGEL